MLPYIIAYIATTVSFFIIDFIWLGFIAKPIYNARIGDLLLESFNIPAAIIFYFLYIVGIMIFVFHPAWTAGSWKTAMVLGCLFGFFCYATYDLTNLATLKGWSLEISLIDMLWGTVLTGAASTIGYLITKAII